MILSCPSLFSVHFLPCQRCTWAIFSAHHGPSQRVWGVLTVHSVCLPLKLTLSFISKNNGAHLGFIPKKLFFFLTQVTYYLRSPHCLWLKKTDQHYWGRKCTTRDTSKNPRSYQTTIALMLRCACFLQRTADALREITIRAGVIISEPDFPGHRRKNLSRQLFVLDKLDYDISQCFEKLCVDKNKQRLFFFSSYIHLSIFYNIL